MYVCVQTVDERREKKTVKKERVIRTGGEEEEEEMSGLILRIQPVYTMADHYL